MSRKVKRAFLSCALLTIIAFTLMLGGTMAWFDDSELLENNYTFGTFGADLLDGNKNTVAERTLKFVKSYSNETFYNDGEFLFEPGATFILEDLYIANTGSVSFQYRIEVERLDDSGVNPASADLLDAMDIQIKMGETDITDSVLKLNANASTEEPVVISLHMREDAGNIYQGLSADGVCVKVYAYQEGTTFEEAFPAE